MSSITSSSSIDMTRREPNYVSENTLALCLDGIVHKHMADFDSYILNPMHREDCLLGDIGAMLVRIMMVVSRLSEDLVSKNHIEEYTKIEIERMRTDHDFSDFDEGDYLLMTEERLQNMLATVRQTASSLENEWAKAPTKPIRAISEVSSSRSDTAPSSPEAEYQAAHMLAPSSFIPQAHMIDGPSANYSMDQSRSRSFSSSTHHERRQALPQNRYAAQYPDLDVLKMRGKGSYHCPQGFACKKGGVVDGQLVLFERNCNFRAHIQKHEKPYKCVLPGCSNKQGFARVDQLKRHQQMVKHDTD